MTSLLKEFPTLDEPEALYKFRDPSTDPELVA